MQPVHTGHGRLLQQILHRQARDNDPLERNEDDKDPLRHVPIRLTPPLKHGSNWQAPTGVSERGSGRAESCAFRAAAPQAQPPTSLKFSTEKPHSAASHKGYGARARLFLVATAAHPKGPGDHRPVFVSMGECARARACARNKPGECGRSLQALPSHAPKQSTEHMPRWLLQRLAER